MVLKKKNNNKRRRSGGIWKMAKKNSFLGGLWRNNWTHNLHLNEKEGDGWRIISTPKTSSQITITILTLLLLFLRRNAPIKKIR